MIDIQHAINLLAHAESEKRAKRAQQHEDMFFAASRSAGRMGLEEGQKLNFAERQKEYKRDARNAGPTFQDTFDRVGGRDHLKALQEICKLNPKFDF